MTLAFTTSIVTGHWACEPLLSVAKKFTTCLSISAVVGVQLNVLLTELAGPTGSVGFIAAVPGSPATLSVTRSKGSGSLAVTVKVIALPTCAGCVVLQTGGCAGSGLGLITGGFPGGAIFIKKCTPTFVRNAP